jgi:hypothetical protein
VTPRFTAAAPVAVLVVAEGAAWRLCCWAHVQLQRAAAYLFPYA